MTDEDLRRLAEDAEPRDVIWPYRTDILDLLARVAKAEAGWQPIETAPHDQWVLVYAAPAHGLPGFVCAALCTREGGWCVDELRHATHWRPLPAAPEPTP